ncbi:MAG: hypothetical protein U5L45_23805 [Saprospiraceae bacterium]|nr:hypothetical protein [Saprospiraceae bacterium]
MWHKNAASPRGNSNGASRFFVKNLGKAQIFKKKNGSLLKTAAPPKAAHFELSS